MSENSSTITREWEVNGITQKHMWLSAIGFDWHEGVKLGAVFAETCSDNNRITEFPAETSLDGKTQKLI